MTGAAGAKAKRDAENKDTCIILTTRAEMPFCIPFAGEGEFFTPDSVLSHCYGALLPMFDTKEATTLRQLCREFKSTVADFPWEDEKTVIMGSVAAWRACFPRARWANVNQLYGGGRRTSVVDADFVHFVGLRRLDMRSCRSITDAAFVHLKNIHALKMSACNQATITDAAFVHLKGIHTLNMALCYQATITDAAFAHLKGIHSLGLFYCHQLTSGVFTHLKGVKRLNIGECIRLNLTDDSLKGIEWLGMNGHTQAQVKSTKSLGYPVDQILHFDV
jgi:hypothetical protein